MHEERPARVSENGSRFWKRVIIFSWLKDRFVFCFFLFFSFIPPSWRIDSAVLISGAHDSIVEKSPATRPYCPRTCGESSRGKSGRERKRRPWEGQLGRSTTRTSEDKVSALSLSRWKWRTGHPLLISEPASFSPAEARELGVGYFSFSHDEEQRRKQRETLDMLRDQVSTWSSKSPTCRRRRRQS